MRKEIVTYLQNNPVDNDGFPLQEHLVDTEFASWQEYLQYIARKNTFGDQLILFAAANLHNVDIQIISTLGAGAQHVFHPSLSIPVATVYPGHFAENHGEHYVSLVPEINNNVSISDDDRTRVDAGDGDHDTGDVDDEEGDACDDADDGDDNVGDGGVVTDNANDGASDNDDDTGDGDDGPCQGNTGDGDGDAGDSNGAADDGDDAAVDGDDAADDGDDAADNGDDAADDGDDAADDNDNAAYDGDDAADEGDDAADDGDDDAGDGGDDSGESDDDAGYEVPSSCAQQFLNNDLLEMIIKITLATFPFMRNSLKCCNKFFKATFDKVPCPQVYIPALPEKEMVISIRRIIMLKGKCSGAVAKRREAINSPRWHQAWIKLDPLEYGWFNISGIYWKKAG